MYVSLCVFLLLLNRLSIDAHVAADDVGDDDVSKNMWLVFK